MSKNIDVEVIVCLEVQDLEPCLLRREERFWGEAEGGELRGFKSCEMPKIHIATNE